MKKAVIGIALTFLGMLSMLVQIVYAVPFVFEIDSWSGSPLWYIIFSDDYFNLKSFFLISTILFLIGLILSIIAFFVKSK